MATELLPFRRVEPSEVEPFVNAVPLYDLKIAAGRFSDEQIVDEVPQHVEVENPEDYEWVSYDGRPRPTQGLFVAQVVGESMNRRIPNGAWCVWMPWWAYSCRGRKTSTIAAGLAAKPRGGSLQASKYLFARKVVQDSN
mgnify:CR=1 FL=1